jgi:predicted dehydrogenase
MVKLAVIGPGKIAEHHIQALKFFDFNVVGCISRKGSSSNIQFMKNLGKDESEYFTDIEYMINNPQDWDAALISCPTSNQLEYLSRLAPTNKPILIEKPVSFLSSDLENLRGYKNIMVGFNRRHYSNISQIKSFMQTKTNVFVKVVIPESSIYKNEYINSSNNFPAGVYENSIHIFDLINYIFGDVEWVSALTSSKEYSYFTSAEGAIANNSHMSLDVLINAPENFSISVYLKDEKVELKPIEILSFYKGFEVIEPSSVLPLRSYNPCLKSQLFEETQMNCKPGFYEQARVFASLCKGKKDLNFPSIEDARKALSSIESIVNIMRTI